MRAAGEVGSKMSLHVECTYLLSNVKEDSIITIVGDTIDTDDPAMFFPPFFTDYPRVKSEGIGIELLEARGLNKRDAISAYKKMGLFNLIDENFLLVLLTMPFWGMIARWHCRNKVVARRIRNIDAVREKQEREMKKSGGVLLFLAAAVAVVLAIVLWRGQMVTQVTGVQDLKTTCDQSCTGMEEEVIDSS